MAWCDAEFPFSRTLIILFVYICACLVEGAGTDGYEAARRARIEATPKCASKKATLIIDRDSGLQF